MAVKVTKDEILEYRMTHSCSLQEARRMLLVEKHLEVLETSQHEEDLRNAVKFLLIQMLPYYRQ